MQNGKIKGSIPQALLRLNKYKAKITNGKNRIKKIIIPATICDNGILNNSLIL